MAAVEESAAGLRELRDRSANAELIGRLGRWLDEKRFDDVSLFVAGVSAVTPGGAVEGLEAVVEQARRAHRMPTQHVITDVLVALDGDRAVVCANVAVAFADPQGPLRRLGGRYRLETVRTGSDWRIARVELTIVWVSSEAGRRA